METKTMDKVKELTFTSIILGVILAVVFGAANAYLGLRVGLTISASIPAAVISMGVFRFVFRKDSVLENNMVQTIGSAGESLAAGMIFTIPAIFLWAKEGKVLDTPDALELMLIAISGGILGALFMIPLRRSLVAGDDPELKFPEGVACADILRAGSKDGKGAAAVFGGLGMALVLQFCTAGLKLVQGSITWPVRFLRGELGLEVSTALAGVGYIVGPKISSVLFGGSLVGWMVIIPIIANFGGEQVQNLYATGGARAVWSEYVRYIGAGAIATGGFISLAKNMPMFLKSFRESMGSFRKSANGKVEHVRTEHDMPMWTILVGSLAVIMFLWLSPYVKCGMGGAILIAVCGFFFAAVSSRMVAVVGSSNNPVSGMGIATLVIATLALKATGMEGAVGMVAAMLVGTVVCVIAAMAGDTSQDLKTGYLLGATPWKQQLGVMIGALATSVAIGWVLYLLNQAWGYGSAEIPAPQATLMKMVVEGIMVGSLPWHLLGIGAALAVVLALTRLPVMSFAIGLYLPIGLNAMIFLGGMLRLFLEHKKGVTEEGLTRGTLFAAGLVAGEGVCGLFLAAAALIGIPLALPFSFGVTGGIILAGLIIATLYYLVNKRK